MVRSGFFNGNNHDRQYYSSDISRLFNALIKDGVFQNIGSKFIARTGTGMQVIIPSGLAYFNSTWLFNDTDYIQSITAAPVVSNYSRIDGIFLKMYPETDQVTRENSIYYMAGTAGASPSRPVPTVSNGEQYIPICYITVGANVTSIAASKITNMVGTSSCPLVSGILNTINAQTLLTQWEAQFNEWLSDNESDFSTWFENLQYVLDGDVAGHLQNEIEELENSVSDIQTPVNNPFTDSRFGTHGTYEIILSYNSGFCPSDFTEGSFAGVITYDGGNRFNIVGAPISGNLVGSPNLYLGRYRGASDQVIVWTMMQTALTNPLTKSDVVNALTSTTTNVPLSAAMGKELKRQIDTKQNTLTNPLTKSDVVNALTSTTTNVPLSAAQGKALNDKITRSRYYEGGYVTSGTILSNVLSALNSGAQYTACIKGLSDAPNTSDEFVIRTFGQYTSAKRIVVVATNYGSMASYIRPIFNNAWNGSWKATTPSLIGTYSADTTIDISGYAHNGDTSKFVLSCSTLENKFADGWYSGTDPANVNAGCSFTQPSISISGNTLSLTCGRMWALLAIGNYDNRTRVKDFALPTKVYFMGG